MLRLIPRPLHRAALRSAHAGRKLWWRLRRPEVEGCRVIALDRAGRVLLIRQSYGRRHWLSPGGGMVRGEDPLAAAYRELREEVGCALLQAAEVAVIRENLHGAVNIVHVVVGHVSEAPVADQREVLEARFFALDALPGDMPERLRSGLPVWLAAYSKES